VDVKVMWLVKLQIPTGSLKTSFKMVCPSIWDNNEGRDNREIEKTT